MNTPGVCNLSSLLLTSTSLRVDEGGCCKDHPLLQHTRFIVELNALRGLTPPALTFPVAPMTWRFQSQLLPPLLQLAGTYGHGWGILTIAIALVDTFVINICISSSDKGPHKHLGGIWDRVFNWHHAHPDSRRAVRRSQLPNSVSTQCCGSCVPPSGDWKQLKPAYINPCFHLSVCINKSPHCNVHSSQA